MSTYVYLACLDHDPPVRAHEESDQHRHNAGVMERIRDWVDRREQLLDMWIEGDFGTPDRYLANSLRFLSDHRSCRIAARDEHGEWIDLGAGMPDQPPPIPAAVLLTRLEEQQAEVDRLAAINDSANAKWRRASDTAQRADRELARAKERRDELHAKLLAAVPSPDPAPKHHLEESA